MNHNEEIQKALRLHQQGLFADAAKSYRRLLERRPDDHGLWHLLGLTHYQRGDLPMAISLVEKALGIEPNNPSVLFNYGKILTDAGQLENACANYRKAIRADPSKSAPFANLASNLTRLLRHREAVDAGLEALNRNPRDLTAHQVVAKAYRHLGCLDKARDHLASAFSVSQQPSFLLQDALLLPPMIDSLSEIDAVRQKLERDLDFQSRHIGPIANPVVDVGMTYFYLSYHGRPNRDLLTKLAETYLRACPGLGYVADHCRKYQGPKERIRIGFVSSYLHKHSIGKTTMGIMAHLDRTRFEVVAVFLPPVIDDEISSFIRENSDVAVDIPVNFWEAQKAIADLALDILFFQDIGMEPFSYFLAFSRLAPIQCTSFGHPDTTGIPNLDWFVSSRLYEPEGAEAHYSERLFQLEDCGTLAYYYRPKLPELPPGRAELGLPMEGNIYLCPQTLFKLHPDFDPILAGILKADPAGYLVILQGSVQEWVDRFLARLEGIDGEIVDRVVVLPPLPTDRFTALVAASDVMLDTLHFNGMNTSLEAFSMGTPVVTLPLALQRGRHTAGMYAAMGIEDAVAKTPQEYIDIAVGLGTDRKKRQELSERILKSNDCLYENPWVVREFERFFTFAMGEVLDGKAES